MEITGYFKHPALAATHKFFTQNNFFLQIEFVRKSQCYYFIDL